MTTRKLAQFEVSSVGIGCMGFSHGYGALPPEEESIRLMRKAFDMGCTLPVGDIAELERAVESIPVIGDRYDAEQQKRVFG